jgi:DNA-dependent RNA polymerase auxiliary subunit epsilon
LIINKLGFFDSFFNTAEYNLNFSELSSSFISDLPSSDKIILGKIAETNSLYIDIKSKLSTARRKISTLEYKLSSLNKLHNESIINTEKRLVQLSIIQKRDVKKINDINVKKISDLKIEHKNEVNFLKNTIKKLE